MNNTKRGRLDYQERKDARINRLIDRADSQQQKSDAHYDSARAIGDNIPFGQPILVGHHSEKRARRDQDRIHSNMQKSIEASNYSNNLSEKANRAASNTAISQDDPDALIKFKEKLVGLEKYHAKGKAGNKICRSKKLTAEQKIIQLSDIGLEVNTKTGYLSFICGSFVKSSVSTNAEIKRIKSRINRIETIDAINFENITINGVKIMDDKDDNRINMYFEGKPSEEIRTLVKQRGFRWSRKNGAWQAYRNQRNWNNAVDVAERINDEF